MTEATATTRSGGPALSLEGIRIHRGGREVLSVPQFAVQPGETVAVLGPNGAGKSTLLLTAALLLPVEAGSVALFGERAEAKAHVRLRRQTSTVFQEPALLDMTVQRNLETALALHEVPRADRAARVSEWLSRLGVAHLAEAMPHTLSGGEARRVSLARAFAVSPRIVFLDEPFSALDLETRAELVGDLRALLREEGATALLVTHDHSEARLLADRALVLLDGTPAQAGPTTEVFTQPASPEVASFLGYSVIARAALPPELVTGAGAAAGETLAVPPEAVRLVDDGGHEATVTAVQGASGQARLVVRLGEVDVAASVTIEDVQDRGIHPGTSVRVALDAARFVSWPD